MKIIIATLCLISISAIAQVPNEKTMTNSNCKKIEEACKKSGYVPGGSEGKKLYADCFSLFVKDEKSQGPKDVKVDDSTIKACKAVAVLTPTPAPAGAKPPAGTTPPATPPKKK